MWLLKISTFLHNNFDIRAPPIPTYQLQIELEKLIEEKGLTNTKNKFQYKTYIFEFYEVMGNKCKHFCD
jgi:hypothetical protein